MKSAIISAAIGMAALLIQSTATAQSNATSYPIAPAAGLYEAFGKEEGLRKLMDDFVQRVASDPQIGHFFKNTDLANLARLLTEQLCELSGGPCKYTGRNMVQAHAGRNITKADFNRLVEVLQQSMDVQGIPFNRQNQMLALLAPMYRDMVVGQ
jgi:hemoglobin